MNKQSICRDTSVVEKTIIRAINPHALGHKQITSWGQKCNFPPWLLNNLIRHIVEFYPAWVTAGSRVNRLDGPLTCSNMATLYLQVPLRREEGDF